MVQTSSVGTKHPRTNHNLVYCSSKQFRTSICNAVTWSWKVQRGGVHDDGRGRPQVWQEGARRILINNFCKQVSWSKLFLKKNFHSQLCNNGAITHFVFQSDKACKNLICEFWKVDRKEKVAQADSILAISFITFRLLLWFDHDYNHDHYYNDNH